VACDDDLPRIMLSHLLRLDELPLEGRAGFLMSGLSTCWPSERTLLVGLRAAELGSELVQV
jgi:hypothetical protein